MLFFKKSHSIFRVVVLHTIFSYVSYGIFLLSHTWTRIGIVFVSAPWCLLVVVVVVAAFVPADAAATCENQTTADIQAERVVLSPPPPPPPPPSSSFVLLLRQPVELAKLSNLWFARGFAHMYANQTKQGCVILRMYISTIYYDIHTYT